MNLWLVLYAASQIGMVAGPLPYDMAECQQRATEGNALVAANKEDPAFIAKAAASGITAPLEDWQFVCIERPLRPPLGEAR